MCYNGVRAVNNMNVNIGPGEFVYVIGPTGAGKSTFIKLLYREEKASSGKVIVAGEDVSKIKNRKVPYFRRNIGIVFQNFRLLPKKTVFELSGGQQQRVAIARAIVNNPKVLIADEPTGNLDPDTSIEIIELLERINEVNHTTILVVTHDKEIVQKYKKRTILIEDGCIKTDTSTGGYANGIH